jgi:hypothetical protein
MELCEEHMQTLERQKEQDLASLFRDPGTLTSTTSQWFEFSVRDLDDQKSYLTGKFLPWVQGIWKAL